MAEIKSVRAKPRDKTHRHPDFYASSSHSDVRYRSPLIPYNKIKKCGTYFYELWVFVFLDLDLLPFDLPRSSQAYERRPQVSPRLLDGMPWHGNVREKGMDAYWPDTCVLWSVFYVGGGSQRGTVDVIARLRDSKKVCRFPSRRKERMCARISTPYRMRGRWEAEFGGGTHWSLLASFFVVCS